MYKIKKVCLKLQEPFLIAVALTTAAMSIHTAFLVGQDWSKIFTTWLVLVGLLMGIWVLNDIIISFKLPRIIIINIVFVLISGFIGLLLLPDFWSYRGLVTRLFLASVITHIYQRGLNSIRISRHLEFEILTLKTESYKAELDNLKKQLDPHFLFNTLSVLQSVIKTNKLADANIYILKLASLYRNMLLSNTSDSVSLNDEMEILDSYLYLQKTRFENGLHTKVEICSKCFHRAIPTFALQLLVENCLKHNIISEEKPLEIHIYQKDPMSVSVRNNWQPKMNSEISTKVGLSNLKRRYELFDIPEGVTIEKENGQFIVTLKLF